MSFSSFRDEDLDVSGVWGESDLSINFSNDDSISTVCSDATVIATSKSKSGTSGPQFKVPAVPKKIFGRCPMCNRSLKTEKGYNNHIVSHKWKEAAQRQASYTDVFHHLNVISKDIIIKIMKKMENNDDLSNVCSQILVKINSKEWGDFFQEVFKVIASKLKGRQVVMPSAIQADLLKSVSAFLSDKVFLSALKEKFERVVHCTDKTWSLLLFDIVSNLVSETVIFLCKSMAKSLSSRQLSSVKNDSGHDLTHQVVHYVAGATLRHFVRHAQQYPKNQKLNRIKECILANFATLGSPPILDKKDKGFWTQLMNRKSLLFVNDKAFAFFNILGKLLMSNEGQDGSLCHKKIMEQVVKEDVLLSLWDETVGGLLSETESFDLMCKVVTITTNTYGRGVMYKRMNEASKSTKDNKKTLQVAHRGRLI